MNAYYHKMLLVGLLSASILTGEVNHVNNDSNHQSNQVMIDQTHNDKGENVNEK